MNARLVLRTALVGACALALGACSHGDNSATPAATATPQHVSVTTSGSGTIKPQRILSGFIAPLQNVTLSTTLSEPAAQVNVVEGDHVLAGQVLAVLDVSDLEANLRALQRSAMQAEANTVRQQFQSAQTIGQGVSSASEAQANLAQAQAKFQLDQTNLERDESLEAKGFIAKQTTDQQRTAVETDRAEIRSSQAAVNSARITVDTNGTNTQGLQGATIAAQRAAAAAARAQGDQLRAQISRGTISSPVDGVVINRNLNPGEYPNNRTLFTIAQSGAVYAVLNASASQVGGVHRGQTVSVALNSEPNKRRSAHVVAVLGQSTPGSTNFTIKAAIDRPDDDLLSGLPLVATITLSSVSGTSIPRSAFSDGTETHVIVVRDGVAHVTPVRVLAENSSTAIVDGITAQTSLVSDGNAGIADGDRVDTAR